MSEGEMDPPDGLSQGYIDVWHPILCGWLGWQEGRFASWASTWDYAIRNVRAVGDWFYHEDELYEILPLLVPDALARILEGRHTKPMYNDLAWLMYEEIDPAIRGRPTHQTWGTAEFDWEEARRRVEAVLGGYAASLPRLDETSSHERWVMKAYSPDLSL